MGKSGALAPPHTRRRLPRYDVDGRFQVRDRASGTVMDLVNVGLGGFCAIAPVVPSPGALHEFEVAVTPPEVLVLKAREVYAYPIEGEADRYAIGWTWTDMALNVDGAAEVVVDLLDYLASAESGVKLVEQPVEEAAD
jgi:hypothetical protein